MKRILDLDIVQEKEESFPKVVSDNKIFWIYNVKKAYIPKINKKKLIKVLITVEEVK